MKLTGCYIQTKKPIYTGAKCEPVYPVTHAYARATMMIYSAWHGAFVYKEDNEYLLQQFKAFIHDQENCPEAVKVSYNRAKLLYKMKEPTSTANDIDYDTFSVKPDQDTIDLVDLASTIYKSFDEDRDTQGINYDYGIDKNWSERTVDVSFDNVAHIIVSIWSSKNFCGPKTTTVMLFLSYCNPKGTPRPKLHH